LRGSHENIGMNWRPVRRVASRALWGQRPFCLLLTGLVCALMLATAHAQSSVPRAAEATFDDESLLLSGDFNVQLTPSMEDALARGVALYFVLDVEIVRERLLFNESIASKSESFRLSFVPLTRSWRLSTGLFNQNLPSLEAATRLFTRLRSTKVVDRKQLLRGERYIVTARLRHDVNQLPKPLQLSALASREWQIDADPIRVVVAP
jgi:hypothetical protein